MPKIEPKIFDELKEALSSFGKKGSGANFPR